jgi:hypothetical protein
MAAQFLRAPRDLSCVSWPGAVLLRAGSTAPSRGSGAHGKRACRRASPWSNSRGCYSALPRLTRRRIVTGRSFRCWPVWACAPARSPLSNLTIWIGMQGNSAFAPGSAGASGCCRCPRRSAPRWPIIFGTAACSIGSDGCSSPSPIQRGPSRPQRSARSCSAIWCGLASRWGAEPGRTRSPHRRFQHGQWRRQL